MWVGEVKNRGYAGPTEAIPKGAGSWKPLLTALPVAQEVNPLLKKIPTSSCHYRKRRREGY